MKLIRVFYYGAIPVIFLLGLYSGVRLFFIIFFFQLLVLLAIVLSDLRMVLSLHYSQRIDEVTGETGGETQLHLEIGNGHLYPVALMELTLELPGETQRLSFSLTPGETRRLDIPVPMPYRGLYRIGVTHVRLTDLFGLTSLRFDLRKLELYRQEELLVYPRAELLDSLGTSEVDTRYGSDLLSSDEGDTMFDLRAWRAGDRESRVHWKASIAHGELLTRRFELPQRESGFVLLDCRAGGRTGEELLLYADTMCRAAACISLYASRRGDALTLAALLPDGLDLCEGNHEARLSWLAALPYTEDAGNPADVLPDFAGVQALYVMTDRPDAALLPSLAEEGSVLVLITEHPWSDARVDCVCIEPGASIAERWLL